MKIAPDLLEHARPMTDLIPLPDNSRHGDIPALAESLRRFGQRKPIVIDGDRVIIAGNHIYQAAALLEATEIAAVSAEDLSAEDRRAYVLADNRLSDLGGYDVELLSAQLAAAAEDAAGLLGTGYDADDLDDVLAALQEQATPDLAGYGDTLADKQADYAAHATRSVVLFYTGARFLWFTDRMEELRDQYGVSSTADALLALIELHFDEKAPDEVG